MDEPDCWVSQQQTDFRFNFCTSQVKILSLSTENVLSHQLLISTTSAVKTPFIKTSTLLFALPLSRLCGELNVCFLGLSWVTDDKKHISIRWPVVAQQWFHILTLSSSFTLSLSPCFTNSALFWWIIFWTIKWIYSDD